jgi:hypothetical protein
MSTRAQIGFYSKDNGGDIKIKPETLIYKHSDGYPDGDCGVMSWLVPFFKDFMERRGADPEYMAAWCIHVICIRQAAPHTNYPEFEDNFRYTGVGCCYEHFLHEDIEYYYSVTPSVIYCTDVYSGEIVATYK